MLHFTVTDEVDERVGIAVLDTSYPIQNYYNCQTPSPIYDCETYFSWTHP